MITTITKTTKELYLFTKKYFQMKPLKNRVLAEKVEVESLIITLEDTRRAKVIAIGDQVKHLKIGDVIQYHNGCGTPYEHEGKKCLFLSEDQDIEVILESTS